MSAPSAPSSGPLVAASLLAHMGDKLRVTLQGDIVIDAILFSCEATDAASLSPASLLVLRAPAAHTFQKADYSIIPAGRVISYEVLARGDGTAEADLVPPSDADVARRIEEAVRRTGDERAARIGVDVPPEAQFVFESIHKTMACRWDGRMIIVMDAVVVRPPYEANDACVVLGAGISTAHYAETRQRVLMIVRKARERLAAGTLPDAPSPIGRGASSNGVA